MAPSLMVLARKGGWIEIFYIARGGEGLALAVPARIAVDCSLDRTSHMKRILTEQRRM